jgi:hypothetical protein
VTEFVFCFTDVRLPTAYFSDIFERNYPPCRGKKCFGMGYAENELREPFEQYLQKKYSYKPGSSTIMCANDQTAANSQADKVSLKGRNPATKIVETGWKYGSPATAGAAPPPTAAQTTTDAAAVPSSPAPVGQTVGFCMTPASAQRVIYFSPAATRNFVAEGDLSRSFAAYLEKKYGYRTFPSCADSAYDLARTASARKAQIDIYRSAGYTVVETDWTYTPVASAPAPVTNSDLLTGHNPTPRPSSPPTSPPPKTAYGVCWVESDPRTAYFSAPFDGANPNYAAWIDGFTNFLRKNYAFRGFVRCNKLNSLDEAMQFLQGRRDALGTTRKIIDTTWKYD